MHFATIWEVETFPGYHSQCSFRHLLSTIQKKTLEWDHQKYYPSSLNVLISCLACNSHDFDSSPLNNGNLYTDER